MYFLFQEILLKSTFHILFASHFAFCFTGGVTQSRFYWSVQFVILLPFICHFLEIVECCLDVRLVSYFCCYDSSFLWWCSSVVLVCWVIVFFWQSSVLYITNIQWNSYLSETEKQSFSICSIVHFTYWMTNQHSWILTKIVYIGSNPQIH